MSIEARSTAPAWPDDARVAVVVTVDHDAEWFWLRLDESVARRAKTRSLGEYGPRRGVPRLLDALRTAEVPSTWFVTGIVAERHRASVEAVAEAGHEIGSRGYELESFHRLSRDQQADAIDRGDAVLERVLGARPRGFRGYDEVTPDTFELLLERGYRWTSLLRGDDRPSFLGGTFDAQRSLVDVPAHWELADMPNFAFNFAPAMPAGQSRIAPYARVLDDWKREFDAYHRHGGLYVLTLDPQSIGKPGRISILNELLAHIRGAGSVWFATAGQVAEYWRTVATTNDVGEGEVIRRRTFPGNE
ncbi:polysaccharide deacetylase [Sphaerisporangium sp. NPDC051011]|uniref:polysaccharide deacetylase family protein n=1 Tax=Sphaerisporangium sp. NPDC051011 TaxID=3155792 RepID=UPI0033C3DB1A